MRGRAVLTSLLVLAVLAGALAPALAAKPRDNSSNTKGFRKAVTVAGAQEHRAALQAIADGNGGTRASGTAGYDQSAQYVFDRLTAAGYSPEFQEFDFPFYRELSAPVFERTDVDPDKAYAPGTDFATMTYSGSGDVTAAISAVDLDIPPPAEPGSDSGCEASDFVGFAAGHIALIQRGTCTFAVKATNAEDAGASAVIIFNEGQAGRTAAVAGTLGGPGFNVPVIGTTFAIGFELSNGVLNGPTGTEAHVKTETESATRQTVNVIAETATGDPNRTVVIGAHLDSVIAGPGLQDNGTGSAGNLEIAETFAAQGREARNRLRFIWFGAEELGLLGSEYYVGSLSQAERDQILLNLNFDMIGSPNFVRFVYDGDGTAGPAGPPGSGFIEDVFVDYFNSQGLASEPTPFNGRSDYGPFIEVGIPAGGLFTGAEGIKTAGQAATYGGTPGVAYDPCYHQACDTFANLSLIGFDQMLDAAAHAALYLSKTNVFSASAAPPVGTDASEVSHWNQVAATTLAAFPGPNGGAPPAFQINMGMVQGAVYDAVNAIGPKQHRPYLLNRRTGAKASIDAAVATAAYDVLSELVSTAPERAPFPGRAGLLSTLSSAYAASLDAIDDDSFKKQGIAVGHAAAEAMLDAREGDGRFGPSPWVSNPAPGHWQPQINPATNLLIQDPTPWAGNVKPFLIQSSSQFRSAPPPALGSAQWAAEFNEVKALGRATGSTRTDEQTYIARWWQSAPILSWNEVARQLIARSGLDAADSARLLALQNLSGADAAINCWNDKYHFDFWRPWNAIPRALEDGNPATDPDATWTALLTAPYPEWTSGHNCLDAAHVAVLRMFFGDDPVGGPFQITSTFVNPGGPAVRTFDTFTQPLAELIEARIWAGLHYRSADVEGQRLGRNVANYGAANYFQPVGN